MAKLYEFNLSDDPWHTQGVFTVPVLLGVTERYQNYLLLSVSSLRVEQRMDMYVLANSLLRFF